MDAEGLSFTCAGLGLPEEDEFGVLTGYVKSEHCLDGLKDLQRYLRRDDPHRRDVFKQLCKWNTVSRDLIPIIEHCQSDRNLVINAVKVLVFLTMPIDPGSDNVAQQIEYLWDLKAAVARNVTIAVVVSLLEDPLDHLEHDAFTEDDWKLVQLLLTLFRNVLAVQEPSLQQKASGSATKFLCLREKFLELLFQENVTDIILVLTQHIDGSCGYLHQDNLLLLEIFHYIFMGQDPELIANASTKGFEVDGGIATSVDSLRSMMEEEKRSTIVRQRNLEHNAQFGGTFTRLGMDGSKTLFKGNPAAVNGDALLKVHRVQRGPLKRIVWDHESMPLPKENILELLYNFLNQFLSGGYNVLMQSIYDDIRKEHQAIENSDITMFFQVADFVIAFQHQRLLASKETERQLSASEVAFVPAVVDNSSFQGHLCGPIVATMNEAMFSLVISKWHEAFEALKETNDHKSVSAAGSLMKNMIQMLYLVLKLLPEHSKEPQTARILLYKLFYDQTEHGLTQFLLNQFKSFDTHKQPKSDLANLLEMIHIIFHLMEKLQARGTLRVARKSRRRRRKKTAKDKDEAETARMREHSRPVNAEDKRNESVMPASESFVDSQNELREPSAAFETLDKDGISVSEPSIELGLSPQGPGHLRDNYCQADASDPSDDDQPPATNEVDFNVARLVAIFATNTVVHNLCWLLKYYRSNSVVINHYIICMLRRFCDDLEISPMLYQLSILTTFYDILTEQKSSMSKEYANIVDFLTTFVRKMLKIMKKQPLLFVEILFWKTRKECHYINAEALKSDQNNLQKEIRSWDCKGGSLNGQEPARKSIADSLGDDEADFVFSHCPNDERREAQSSDEACELRMLKTKQSLGHGNNREFVSKNDVDKNSDNELVSCDLQTRRAPARRKAPAFDQEQETNIRNLYEKYKDDRRCSRLIAEALDPEGKISALQVSRKLRQLGLKAATIRKLAPEDTFPARDDPIEGFGSASTNDAAILNSKKLDDNSVRRRKRIRAFSQEQELKVKALFECFKNHEKCNQMIASSLDVNSTYTAAQVSRKLKQLGLIVPKRKRTSEAVKQSSDTEDIKMGQQFEEEIRKKLVKKKSDVTEHETEPSHTGGIKAANSAAVDYSLEDKQDSAGSSEESVGLDVSNGEATQEGPQVPCEMMDDFGSGEEASAFVPADLIDSGDEMEPLPKLDRSRRSLRMVIDVEDDE